MIPNESLVEIARKLLEKSRAGKVLWRKTPGDNNSYFVAFPGSQLVVSFVCPTAEPDFVRLCVVGSDKQWLGFLDAEEDSPHWSLFRGIYEEAERRVTGWDKVLHEIELQLDDQGFIGAQTETNNPEGVPF